MVKVKPPQPTNNSFCLKIVNAEKLRKKNIMNICWCLFRKYDKKAIYSKS